MPDYKQGKIYKLWSPQGEEIYIGSTTQSLAKRKSGHKEMNCCSKLLFEKYDDVRIELIEQYPCENKMELNRREGEHIRNNNCINRYIAGRTIKEYREDNKEKIKEYEKEWYEDNKEKIKQNDKEWYENNKEKILEQHKEYYENHKEKILEHNKEYYENNKEKILEYQKEYKQNNKEKIKKYKKEYNEKKVICQCGCEVRRDSLPKHKRTRKHTNFINQ